MHSNTLRSDSKFSTRLATPSSPASTHRAFARGLFAPGLPAFHVRFGRELYADALELQRTVRPTRLYHVALAHVRHVPDAPLNSSSHRVHSRPHPNTALGTFMARLLSAAAQGAVFLGAAIGFVFDDVVVAVVLAFSLPYLVVRAFCAALAPKGLSIDRGALRADALEDAFRKVVQKGVNHVRAGHGDGISAQFEKDVSRQTMFVSTAQAAPFVQLAPELALAKPFMQALCTDNAGVLDTAWLWAVTDLSAQGLLNEVYAQLLGHEAMRWGQDPCTVSLNGDTSMHVRRVQPDLVSVTAQMRAPQGVKVGLLGPQTQGGIKQDKTPIGLNVEVAIRKPKSDQDLPHVRVTHLALTLL